MRKDYGISCFHNLAIVFTNIRIVYLILLVLHNMHVLIYYVSPQMFIFATNLSMIYFNAQSAQKVPAVPDIAQSVPTRQQKVLAVPGVYQ